MGGGGGETGAGGWDDIFKGSRLLAIFNIGNGQGISQFDRKGWADTKIASWGNEKPKGPLAKALSEAFQTLRQGGMNLMEGVGALGGGMEGVGALQGDNFDYHPGEGMNFTALNTPGMGGSGGGMAIGGDD